MKCYQLSNNVIELVSPLGTNLDHKVKVWNSDLEFQILKIFGCEEKPTLENYLNSEFDSSSWSEFSFFKVEIESIYSQNFLNQ